jgi:CheY-like chemotaxis protein
MRRSNGMKKILIVDDQKEVRELVEITLRSGKYKILQAKNAQEAVKTVKEEKPDLVIMDIMMPGEMDGLEATRLLKENPQTKECKIIMLTAKGQTTDLDEGIKAGVDGYFIKPFSPLDLISKVEEVIG